MSHHLRATHHQGGLVQAVARNLQPHVERSRGVFSSRVRVDLEQLSASRDLRGGRSSWPKRVEGAAPVPFLGAHHLDVPQQKSLFTRHVLPLCSLYCGPASPKDREMVGCVRANPTSPGAATA